MSLVFNDATNELGICQEVDTICGTDSVSYPLKEKARRANLALSDFISIALGSDDRWSFDDSNYEDLPIGSTDIEINQSDYTISTDMLKILKVELVRNGVSTELIPIDRNDFNQPLSEVFNTPGTPTHYDKFDNSIFLYPTPNEEITGGLKVYFQRDASQFVSTDTTKLPGIPSVFHKYIALKIAEPYLRDASKENYVSVRNEIEKYEVEKIPEFMSKRSKDERPKMTGRFIDCR